MKTTLELLEEIQYDLEQLEQRGNVLPYSIGFKEALLRCIFSIKTIAREKGAKDLEKEFEKKENSEI